MTQAQELARDLIAALGPSRAEDHAYGAWERAHRLGLTYEDQLWTAVRVEIQYALIA